jgi:HEAT repeat protein
VDVRCEAEIALGEIGDKGAVPFIILCLKDGDPRVRWWAAWALGELPDEPSVLPLMSTLKDPYLEVRAFSAEALGNIGDKRSIGDLVKCLGDDEENVRLAAGVALAKMGRPDGVKELIAALTDNGLPGCENRLEIVNLLGNIGGPEVLAALKRVERSDDYPEMKEAAKKVLQKIAETQPGK